MTDNLPHPLSRPVGPLDGTPAVITGAGAGIGAACAAPFVEEFGL
jgi:hypothetical protein